MRRLVHISFALIGAAAVALLLVAVGPVSRGWLSGSVMIPLFFLWWVIVDRQRIPWWWVLLVLSMVDALAFTPRGGMLLGFGFAAATLAFMDHAMPSHRLSTALAGTSVASAVLMGAVSTILFTFFAPSGVVIQTQTTVLHALVIVIITDLSVVLLWPFRDRKHFAFAL